MPDEPEAAGLLALMLEAYRQALELAGSDAERRFLTKRLAEVGDSESAS